MNSNIVKVISFPYRPEVDGLRALAVISVILFHAGFAWFRGGYVGVDIFFVISGYLITSIILNEKQIGTFSVVNFYERRVRRILPALFFMMLVCLPFAWLWMIPYQFKDFSQSLIAVLLFSSNILFAYTSGYFDAPAAEKPLLHTWSLGIEEQYYLLFPIFIIVCWQWRLKRIAIVIILLTFFSLGLSEWAWHRGKTIENFFFLFTRAWELLIGSLTAFISFSRPLHQRISQSISSQLSLVGLILVFFSIFFYDETTPFPSLYALVPTIGTALILTFANKFTLVAKILSFKWIVSIGLISYSAYLWHYPIFAFYKIRFNGNWNYIVAISLIILCFILAFCSWKFIENSFRNKNFINRKSVFFVAVTAFSLMATVGVLGHVTEGFRSSFEKRLTAAQRERFKAIDQATKSSPGDYGQCKFRARNVTAEFINRYNRCRAKYTNAILILGDSHAIDLFNAVSLVSKNDFVVGLARGGCRPHTPHQDCHYDKAYDFILNNKENISTIFYTQKGSYFLTDYSALPLNEEFIKRTQDYIKKLNLLVPVIWIGPRVEPNIDLRAANVLFDVIPLNGKDYENKDIYSLDSYLLKANRKSPYTYISTINLLAYKYESSFFVNGKYTYADKDHWSRFGEEFFGLQLLNNKVISSKLKVSYFK